jgi:hypothetical protein
VSDLISRTAKLVPYARRPKGSASFVTAYAYEPVIDEPGSHLGNLYVVVEVLISGRASEEVVDLVIQSAGDRYYNDPDSDLKPLARFEAAVKQINHELSEYVGRGNAAWIGKLSAIIAVSAGSELHVAQTGSGEAFLYRGKATSRISVPEITRPATPSKTFGSIATGELDSGDRLLLATPALVHQIPLEKLQNLIINTSPNASIFELKSLLEGASTNRIAAIIVEITTPELAALKVRSEAPAAIELSSGDSLAESAFKAAAPVAQSTVNHTRKAATNAARYLKYIQVEFRKITLAAADFMRQKLATKKGKLIGVVTIIVILISLLLHSWLAAGTQKNSAVFKDYQNLYGQFKSAKLKAQSGDKLGARSTLITIQTEITKLSPNFSSINEALKNNPLQEGEPTSIDAFKSLILDQINILDGLIEVSPLTVADIGLKNSKPEHFEIDGKNAYVIDSFNHNNIAIVDLNTGNQKDTLADTSKLGDVINTTLSVNNDGMYILTSKPSVWFYRFASDSLIQQDLAYGSWPKSTAIASYASNLYLLSDSVIYKHVKNATGYSPATNYISTTQATIGSTGLAVDGWVYIVSPAGLNRFLGDSLKQTLVIPTELGHITNLRSVNEGNNLMGISQSTNRLAFWSAKGDLSLSQQFYINDGKKLYDAEYAPKLGKVFATIDNRLVSFPLKP